MKNGQKKLPAKPAMSPTSLLTSALPGSVEYAIMQRWRAVIAPYLMMPVAPFQSAYNFIKLRAAQAAHYAGFYQSVEAHTFSLPSYTGMLSALKIAVLGAKTLSPEEALQKQCRDVANAPDLFAMFRNHYIFVRAIFMQMTKLETGGSFAAILSLHQLPKAMFHIESHYIKAKVRAERIYKDHYRVALSLIVLLIAAELYFLRNRDSEQRNANIILSLMASVHDSAASVVQKYTSIVHAPANAYAYIASWMPGSAAAESVADAATMNAGTHLAEPWSVSSWLTIMANKHWANFKLASIASVLPTAVQYGLARYQARASHFSHYIENNLTALEKAKNDYAAMLKQPDASMLPAEKKVRQDEIAAKDALFEALDKALQTPKMIIAFLAAGLKVKKVSAVTNMTEATLADSVLKECERLKTEKSIEARADKITTALETVEKLDAAKAKKFASALDSSLLTGTTATVFGEKEAAKRLGLGLSEYIEKQDAAYEKYASSGFACY